MARSIALEVNSLPDRRDLPDALIPAARARGARFVVSTDSHSVRALDNLAWGVAGARRGGLTADDVLNTREVGGLRAALRPH